MPAAVFGCSGGVGGGRGERGETRNFGAGKRITVRGTVTSPTVGGEAASEPGGEESEFCNLRAPCTPHTNYTAGNAQNPTPDCTPRPRHVRSAFEAAPPSTSHPPYKKGAAGTRQTKGGRLGPDPCPLGLLHPREPPPGSARI